MLDTSMKCGRPTLICGSSCIGKTLFGMEFLIRGIQQYHIDQISIVLRTLIKYLPSPLRMIVGDLSDKEKVILALGMIPEETGDAE
jgi:hypothetical protein